MESIRSAGADDRDAGSCQSRRSRHWHGHALAVAVLILGTVLTLCVFQEVTHNDDYVPLSPTENGTAPALNESASAWVTLAAGFLFTGFVAACLMMKQRRLARVERVIRESFEALGHGCPRIGRDSGERVTLSAVLARERATIERILDQNPYSIAVFSPEGRFVRGNAAFFRLFGRSGPSDEYNLFEDHILLESGLQPQLEKLRRGAAVEIPAVRYNPSLVEADAANRTLFVAGRAFPIFDGDAEIDSIIVMHEDVTPRKEAEARIQELQSQLAHASRLRTMGELAAGFAHELNQPLTAITSYARAAMRNIVAKNVVADDLRATLDKINQQAERANAIIRGLRGYIRPTTQSTQTTKQANVNDCAREAVALLDHAVRQHDIQIQLSLKTGLSDVSIGRIELVQVFVNLLLNATEVLASAKPSDRKLRIQTAAIGPRRIEVLVSDNGPGLPQGAIEQLFEPFVTTKPDGMGVGLAICRRILESHGGRLSAANNDAGGATFTFSLPAVRERSADGN